MKSCQTLICRTLTCRALREERPSSFGRNKCFAAITLKNHVLTIKTKYYCLSGQEMAPTGQRPMLKDSWCQNSILWEGQLVNPIFPI